MISVLLTGAVSDKPEMRISKSGKQPEASASLMKIALANRHGMQARSARAQPARPEFYDTRITETGIPPPDAREARGALDPRDGRARRRLPS